MNNDISSIIREDLREFSAYSSARMEAKTGDIFLNANESPWADEAALNRYPTQQNAALNQALSQFYQVDPAQILTTRGSDEGIDLLIRLCCQAQRDAILICPPTFGMYEVSARLQGAKVIQTPLKPNTFDINLAEVLNNCQPNVKLVFLCSPNNPTGNTIALDDTAKLCQQLLGQCIVVIDEAYIEFSGQNSACSLLSQYNNLVVLRTLSKAFGLAAARIGALLANPTLIHYCQKILPPYPLPTLSVEAAITATNTTALKNVQQAIAQIRAERYALFETLKTLAITQKVWPSDANFLLVQFNRDVFEQCREQGIILRNMSQKIGVPNTVRITIGTPQENKTLTNLLRKL